MKKHSAKGKTLYVLSIYVRTYVAMYMYICTMINKVLQYETFIDNRYFACTFAMHAVYMLNR